MACKPEDSGQHAIEDMFKTKENNQNKVLHMM